MKKLPLFLLPLFTLFAFQGLVGCASTPTSNDDESSEKIKTHNFHYKDKNFYLYDQTHNNNEGGYLLIDGVPWSNFPPHLLIPGGYRNPSFDKGVSTYNDKTQYRMIVVTSGGADSGADITKWYASQLEDRGWEIDNLNIGNPNDFYSWNRFLFSDANWRGEVEVCCRDTEKEADALNIFEQVDKNLDLLFYICVNNNFMNSAPH